MVTSSSHGLEQPRPHRDHARGHLNVAAKHELLTERKIKEKKERSRARQQLWPAASGFYCTAPHKTLTKPPPLDSFWAVTPPSPWRWQGSAACCERRDGCMCEGLTSSIGVVPAWKPNKTLWSFPKTRVACGEMTVMAAKLIRGLLMQRR
ncbi:uncharacterized protein [Anas acuta]